MRIFILVPYYIRWHYGQALKNIVGITKNLLWFFWHFFSIGLLARTLFMPWQKMQEERQGFDLGAFFSTLIINSLMRIAGALIRLFMIVMGLATILVTLIGAIAIFIIWLAFPLVIIFVILVGVLTLAKP